MGIDSNKSIIIGKNCNKAITFLQLFQRHKPINLLMLKAVLVMLRLFWMKQNKLLFSLKCNLYSKKTLHV